MFSSSHLHPMLVHFPIALIVLGFVADLINIIYKKELGFSKISFYLLITGTLSAIATLLSGIFFTSEMSGTAGEVLETHETFAWITVSLLFLTSVIRIVHSKRKDESKGLKWLAFAVYGLSTLSVSITGFYGGTLVYNYMMPL